MEPNRLPYLWEKYIAGDCTNQEMLELLEIVEKDSEKEAVLLSLKQYWQQATNMKGSGEINWDNKYSLMMEKINKEEPHTEPVPIVKRLWSWKNIAIAVSVILLVGVGSYLFFADRSTPRKPDMVNQPQQERFKNDVKPGEDGAILTLADQKEILLDSAGNGNLAQQANIKIVKNGNVVSYVFTPESSTTAVAYNTMRTPRGRQFQLVLADGSKVTLDAESSIRFPTSFTGTERKVEITGQAYFEVTHNKEQPFIVQKGRTSVEVLGTEFNVNTYEDETDIKITLLKGSVRVKEGDKLQMLVPGQQAQVKGGIINVLSNTDVDEVMAWKNGIFQSENATVESVMRNISRWYDVDVVYERPVTKRVSLLNVPRSVTLVNILKIMEMTGNVKFVIEGKTITVL